MEDAIDGPGEGERDGASRYFLIFVAGFGGNRCSEDPIRLNSELVDPPDDCRLLKPPVGINERLGDG